MDKASILLHQAQPYALGLAKSLFVCWVYLLTFFYIARYALYVMH